MSTQPNTEGREANAAQPLGERKGTASNAGTDRVGHASRRKAGPDGGDSAAVGETFKSK